MYYGSGVGGDSEGFSWTTTLECWNKCPKRRFLSKFHPEAGGRQGSSDLSHLSKEGGWLVGLKVTKISQMYFVQQTVEPQDIIITECCWAVQSQHFHWEISSTLSHGSVYRFGPDFNSIFSFIHHKYCWLNFGWILPCSYSELCRGLGTL